VPLLAAWASKGEFESTTMPTMRTPQI
jgi:hypothetical protein